MCQPADLGGLSSIRGSFSIKNATLRLASDGPGLSRTVLDELARSCQRVRPDMQEMAEGFLGDRAVERKQEAILAG